MTGRGAELAAVPRGLAAWRYPPARYFRLARKARIRSTAAWRLSSELA
jgi:hypothetical protein